MHLRKYKTFLMCMFFLCLYAHDGSLLSNVHSIDTLKKDYKKGVYISMRKRLFVLLFALFLLAACSSSQEKIIENVIENQRSVEFVHVYGEETVGNMVRIIDDTYNFKEGKIQSELPDTDSVSYKDKNQYFMYSSLNIPTLPPDKLGTMRASLDRREALYQNPFVFFERYDEDFTDHLAMEDKDGHYLLRYAPEDEEIRDDFYKQFILEFLMDAQDENESDDPLEEMTFDVEDFVLTFKVDENTELITEMTTLEQATIELEGTSVDMDRKTEYIFDEYDDEVTIEIPAEAFEITTEDTYLEDQFSR